MDGHNVLNVADINVDVDNDINVNVGVDPNVDVDVETLSHWLSYNYEKSVSEEI